MISSIILSILQYYLRKNLVAFQIKTLKSLINVHVDGDSEEESLRESPRFTESQYS